MTELSEHDLTEVWAGRLELRLKAGTPEYAKGLRGAFTTVLVRCADAMQFVASAAEHVDREGFVISGIENLFPLGAGHIQITDVVTELALLTRDYPVQWTTFHLFKDD